MGLFRPFRKQCFLLEERAPQGLEELDGEENPEAGGLVKETCVLSGWEWGPWQTPQWNEQMVAPRVSIVESRLLSGMLGELSVWDWGLFAYLQSVIRWMRPKSKTQFCVTLIPITWRQFYTTFLSAVWSKLTVTQCQGWIFFYSLHNISSQAILGFATFWTSDCSMRGT